MSSEDERLRAADPGTRHPPVVCGPSWCGPSSRSSPGSIRARCRPKGAMGLMQLMPATATQPRRQQPVGSGTEHSRRDSTTFAAARPARRQRGTGARGLQRRLGGRRASTAAGYLPIARHATTFARWAPLPASRRASDRDRSSSSTRPSRSSTAASCRDTPRSDPRPGASRSSAAEVRTR